MCTFSKASLVDSQGTGSVSTEDYHDLFAKIFLEF
jgi:hypothetical protein